MSPRSRALFVLLLTLGVLSSAVAWQSSSSKPEAATDLLPALKQSGLLRAKGLSQLHMHVRKALSISR